MKKSLIWTAVSVGVIGIGVPAFAAVQTSKPRPTTTTVKTTVEDVRGNCDEAEHANDPSCASMVLPATPAAAPALRPTVSIDDSTRNSVDDSATANSVEDSTHDSIDDNGDDDATDNSLGDDTKNSVDDTTSNSVEDVSGPCDEAEHANDPSCTTSAAPVNSVDDNSAQRGNSGTVDDSGHHNGGVDDSGHGGAHG
jgi:hypothetical protein